MSEKDTQVNTTPDYNYILPESVFLDTELNGTDLRVYGVVSSFILSRRKAYPSNKWIADKIGISDPTTVSKSISKLCQLGHLVRYENDNHQRFLTLPLTPQPNENDEKPEKEVSRRGVGETTKGAWRNRQGGVGEKAKQSNINILLKDNINKFVKKVSEQTNFKPSSHEMWSPKLQQERNNQAETLVNSTDWRDELIKQYIGSKK
jgi:hypothetical protein